MLILFGPQGSGKSTQVQLLAEKHDWKRLSTGQIFRDMNDDRINSVINHGELVADEIVNELVFEILDRDSVCGEKGGLITDGYPRNLDQAKMLIKYWAERCGHNNINLAIMIDVNKAEVINRMMLRGRDDDTLESIEKRLATFYNLTEPILSYFEDLGIEVVHIDGEGSVEEIHARIEAELIKHGIVEA